MPSLDPKTVATVTGSRFSPTSIGGFLFWIDASKINASDGDAIGTINDVAGSTAFFTQATGSKQPLMKLGILNGYPVLRFDATDDTMSSTNLSVTQPEHIFAVLRYNAANISNDVAFDSSSTNNRVRLSRTGATQMSINAGTGVNLTGVDTLSFHIYSCEFNGASSILRSDENSSVTGNAGAGATGGMVINSNATASAAFGGMDLAEFIIYSSILSDGDRMRVEKYLSKKYNITI